MRAPTQLFIETSAIVVVVFGAVSILLWRRISSSPAASRARIKLQPEKFRLDMGLLTVTHGLFAVLTAAYAIAGWYQADQILALLEMGMVVLILPIIVVFIRVWRRI